MKTALELSEGKQVINTRTKQFEYRLGGVMYLWNGLVKGMVEFDQDRYL